jgi:hypothetical protein
LKEAHEWRANAEAAGTYPGVELHQGEVPKHLLAPSTPSKDSAKKGKALKRKGGDEGPSGNPRKVQNLETQAESLGDFGSFDEEDDHGEFYFEGEGEGEAKAEVAENFDEHGNEVDKQEIGGSKRDGESEEMDFAETARAGATSPGKSQASKARVAKGERVEAKVHVSDESEADSDDLDRQLEQAAEVCVCMYVCVCVCVCVYVCMCVCVCVCVLFFVSNVDGTAASRTGKAGRRAASARRSAAAHLGPAHASHIGQGPLSSRCSLQSRGCGSVTAHTHTRTCPCTHPHSRRRRRHHHLIPHKRSRHDCRSGGRLSGRLGGRPE